MHEPVRDSRDYPNHLKISVQSERPFLQVDEPLGIAYRIPRFLFGLNRKILWSFLTLRLGQLHLGPPSAFGTLIHNSSYGFLIPDDRDACPDGECSKKRVRPELVVGGYGFCEREHLNRG